VTPGTQESTVCHLSRCQWLWEMTLSTEFSQIYGWRSMVLTLQPYALQSCLDMLLLSTRLLSNYLCFPCSFFCWSNWLTDIFHCLSKLGWVSLPQEVKWLIFESFQWFFKFVLALTIFYFNIHGILKYTMYMWYTWYHHRKQWSVGYWACLILVQGQKLCWDFWKLTLHIRYCNACCILSYQLTES